MLMSASGTNVITRYTLILITMAALLLSVTQASTNALKNDRSECYVYLTELVRSSNFPFTT